MIDATEVAEAMEQFGIAVRQERGGPNLEPTGRWVAQVDERGTLRSYVSIEKTVVAAVNGCVVWLKGEVRRAG